MNTKQNVFLVGPMGAGKTSIGRRLAELLGYEFIDCDHEIEARTGASIPWIFDVEGESGFRKREVAMLEELSQRTHIVLATGGGAVIQPVNRKILMESGVVVYLRSKLEDLVKRTARDKNRPLLQTDDPEKKLAELLEQREPWYLEVADIIFDTNARNVKDAAKLLKKQVTPLLQ